MATVPLTRQTGDAPGTVLRMDDVGASTKHFEQYGRLPVTVGARRVPTPPFLHWGFVKRLPSFRAWGVYDELKAGTWQQIVHLLRHYKARLTVGMTACWVEKDGALTPFPEKFPEQTRVLQAAVREGVLEIANHGLTHCVLNNKMFLPRMFGSNRRYHREFWEWIPAAVHEDHIRRAQYILQTTFRTDVVTFVPPGSVWTPDTERYAVRAGLRYLSSNAKHVFSGTRSNGLTYVGADTVTEFHDRELALGGAVWLERLLRQPRGRFFTVREYCEHVFAAVA